RDFHVTGVQTCALPILKVFVVAGAYILLCQRRRQTIKQAGRMDKGGGKKGGKGFGMSPDDLRLWRAFTRDIDPLEEPDWEGLDRSEERRVGKDSRERLE